MLEEPKCTCRKGKNLLKWRMGNSNHQWHFNGCPVIMAAVEAGHEILTSG